MIKQNNNHAIRFICTLVAQLVGHKKLTRRQIVIVAMIQDLLDYLDMKFDDRHLLRSINAFRNYAEKYDTAGDPHNEDVTPFVLKPDPLPEPDEPDTCSNCDTVLTPAGYCPHCAEMRRHEQEVDRLELRIRNLETEKSDLEYNLRDARREADKVSGLERQLRAAEYRADQAAHSRSWQ